MLWLRTDSFYLLCDVRAIGLASRLRGLDLLCTYPHTIRCKGIVARP